jgi:hypothetical protein
MPVWRRLPSDDPWTMAIVGAGIATAITCFLLK